MWKTWTKFHTHIFLLVYIGTKYGGVNNIGLRHE